MRVAVYGGSGCVGSRVVAEALARDHRVSVLTRHPAKGVPQQADALIRDAADGDAVAKVASEHDVVVSAIGPSRSGGRVESFLDALNSLIRNVGTRRLLIVGHAGPLFVAPGLRLMDTSGFPSECRSEALGHLAALRLLQNAGGFVEWVYVSPPQQLSPGERNGSYRVGSDTVMGDQLSLEDFAVAILDEIERPRHRRERFAVSA